MDHTLHRLHSKKRSLGLLFPSQSEPAEEELFPEAEAKLTYQVSPKQRIPHPQEPEVTHPHQPQVTNPNALVS